MPVRQKRDALVGRLAFDDRRNRGTRWRGARSRCYGERGYSRRWSRCSSGLLLAPRSTAPRLGRGLDHLLALANHRPVELDVGILRFDLAQHLGLQWIAADPHASGRAEYIQDLRP